MTQDNTTQVTQADRLLVADILDEVSGLLDHVGIGQVADLIRDGEFDEHECVDIACTHRLATEAASRSREDALAAEVERLRGALTSLENAACMVGQWRSTIMCRFDGKLDWGQWNSLNNSFDRLEEKRRQSRAALSASDGEG